MNEVEKNLKIIQFIIQFFIIVASFVGYGIYCKDTLEKTIGLTILVWMLLSYLMQIVTYMNKLQLL